jgi:hypothetical protein
MDALHQARERRLKVVAKELIESERMLNDQKGSLLAQQQNLRYRTL